MGWTCLFSANCSGFISKILKHKKKENTNLYHGPWYKCELKYTLY